MLQVHPVGRRKVKRGYPSRLSGVDYALELWGLGPPRAEDQQATTGTLAQKETSTMDATATAVQTDDIEIVVPVGGDDEEYEPIPPGAYPGRLTQFRVVDKPEWKQEQDLKRNPDKPVDKLQWEWTFELEGEYAGVVIVDYTSRSWHERANAHKHAAALLGKPYLQPVEGMSTKQLIGNACQVWVTESTSKTTGKTRNYVDKILPVPTRKGKTAPAPEPEEPPDLEF